jgi:hypothetical protein
MRIIPTVAHFEIRTNFDRPEVVERIRTKIAKRHVGDDIFSSGMFVGELYPLGFDLKKGFRLNAGFNPVFQGSFEKAGMETVVKVKASNDLAALKVLVMLLISVVLWAFGFRELVHGNYSSAGICACVGIGIGAGAFLSSWFYDQAIREGKEELICLCKGKQDRTGPLSSS